MVCTVHSVGIRRTGLPDAAGLMQGRITDHDALLPTTYPGRFTERSGTAWPRLPAGAGWHAGVLETTWACRDETA